MAVVVAAVVVTVAGALSGRDAVSAPSGPRLSAGAAEAEADPAVTEAGAVPCPAPVPGSSPVLALSGTVARCVGSVQPVDVGVALGGAPALVNLWASWCAPCREEMSVLDAYEDAPGAVRVIGVNVRDRPTSAAALVRDLHIGYPSYTDADAVAAALGAPQVLPLSYLVGTDGSVRRLPMRVFRNVAQVTDAVAAALGETQKP